MIKKTLSLLILPFASFFILSALIFLIALYVFFRLSFGLFTGLIIKPVVYFSCLIYCGITIFYGG